MGFVFATLVILLFTALLAFAPLWRAKRVQALAFSALLCGGAVGLYALLGEPDALHAYWREAPKDLPQAIAQTERALQRDAEDAERWAELARLRAASGDHAKASQAFDRALALDGDQADWLIEAAESAMRSSQDRAMPDSGLTRLLQALKLAPDHSRGLLLLGAVQAQRGDADTASDTWKRLLPQLGEPAAAALRQQIATVRERAGLPPMENDVPHDTDLLRMEITSTQAAPEGAVLFVFARSTQGGMPIAARRVERPRFPLSIGMGDTHSPMPNGKLSEHRKVWLQARLSMSGNAQAAEGDWNSSPVEVRVGDTSPHRLSLRPTQ